MFFFPPLLLRIARVVCLPLMYASPCTTFGLGCLPTTDFLCLVRIYWHPRVGLCVSKLIYINFNCYRRLNRSPHVMNFSSCSPPLYFSLECVCFSVRKISAVNVAFFYYYYFFLYSTHGTCARVNGLPLTFIVTRVDY